MKKAQQNKTAETLRLENIMGNCYGTENYYRNNLLSFRYTDGVKTFAQEAGAYWFLQELNRFISRIDDFVAFKLIVEGSSADILMDDKKVRHIGFTDCPEGEWLFFYDPVTNVLLWHGEY